MSTVALPSGRCLCSLGVPGHHGKDECHIKWLRSWGESKANGIRQHLWKAFLVCSLSVTKCPDANFFRYKYVDCDFAGYCNFDGIEYVLQIIPIYNVMHQFYLNGAAGGSVFALPCRPVQTFKPSGSLFRSPFLSRFVSGASDLLFRPMLPRVFGAVPAGPCKGRPRHYALQL